MTDPNDNLPDRPSGWQLFISSFLRSHKRRPVSFYLLFALLAIVFLGAQVIYFKDDPRKLAFFLSLNFIVCFVIVYRAIIDAFDIMRAHLKEQKILYKNTLGEQDFTRTLGKRVLENSPNDDANQHTPN